MANWLTLLLLSPHRSALEESLSKQTFEGINEELLQSLLLLSRGSVDGCLARLSRIESAACLPSHRVQLSLVHAQCAISQNLNFEVESSRLLDALHLLERGPPSYTIKWQTQ